MTTRRGRRIYYVAATSRTGSSWLCNMLASSGVAGFPREYGWHMLDPYQLTERWNRYADDDPFGSKVTYGELASLWGREMSIEDCRNCRIVWMRRHHRVAQAISLYRANESNCWHISAGEASPESIRNVPFDRAKIIERLNQIQCHDALLDHWLAHHEQPVMQVWYEDLVDNPEGVTRNVLEFLGFDSRVPFIVDHYERMAGETTHEWIEMIGNPTAPDTVR